MKNIKAILLRELFPQNDSKIPKLRFKGFEEKWEEKRLEEIITIHNGKDYKHLSKGDIPVYGSGGYMCSVDKALSYNEDALGIGRKGNIDKPFILKAPFWTVDTLFYCFPNDGYDLYFIYCLFQNINWQEFSETTGVPSLPKKNIYNVKVLVPKKEEQKKIGECLFKVDELAMLYKEKCKMISEI